MDIMMESPFALFIISVLDLLSTLFVVALGVVFAIIVIMFIIDVTQSSDAVRRNYPVLGRFRYLFSELGEFFRQYFFAMDREEMPFNRAERDWVDRAAKGKSNTIAFGSTKNLTPPGTSIFVNSPFPALMKKRIWCNRCKSGHMQKRHMMRRVSSISPA